MTAPQKLPKDKLALVRDLLAKDTPPTEIARALKIPWRQFKNQAKTDDALGELIEEALEREKEQLRAALRNPKKGDNVAGPIFTLKAKFGFRDSSPTPQTAAPVQVAVITLPAPASGEAYLQHVRAMGLLPAYQPTPEEMALVE